MDGMLPGKKEVTMEDTTITVQLFDEGICRIELPRMLLNTKVYCNDVCMFIFAPSRSSDALTCGCEPSCLCAERAAGATGGCQFPLEEHERLRIDVYDAQGQKKLFMATYILGKNGLKSEIKYMAKRGVDVQVLPGRQNVKEHAPT